MCRSCSRKGIIPKNLDLLHTDKLILAKMGESHMGELNFKWTGEKVKYRALHSWVERKLGKANVCTKCGKEKTTPKSIQWANISRNYLRELSDWIQLCVPCHKRYDLDFKKTLCL